MIRRARRFLPILLVALVAAAVAAPAGATNAWHNNNGMTYGSGSGAVFNTGWWISRPVTVRVSFNTGTPITCTGANAEGNLAGPGSAYGATGPTAGTWQVTSVNLVFDSCSPVDSHVLCNEVTGLPPASFTTGVAPGAYNGGTPTSYAGVASTVLTGPRLVTGTLVDIECDVYFSGGYCVTFAGSVNLTYYNPSAVGGSLSPPNLPGQPSAGLFSLASAGQSLSVSGPHCSDAPAGATTAQISSAAGGNVSYLLPRPALAGTVNPVIWYGTL